MEKVKENTIHLSIIKDFGNREVVFKRKLLDMIVFDYNPSFITFYLSNGEEISGVYDGEKEFSHLLADIEFCETVHILLDDTIIENRRGL